MSSQLSSNPTWHRSTRSTACRLFLTCWIVYVLHFATNIVREVYPALSLGDHLSFDVSEYEGLHPDIFELEGHGTFINNNPGASMVGAIPYLLARPVIDRVTRAVLERRKAGGAQEQGTYESPWPMAREFYRRAHARGLDVKFGLAAGFMQALAMAPLSAMSVVVMFYVLRGLGSSTRSGLWISLLYAFATPVFYRTAQLNQNLLTAHFAFLGFVLLWRPWDRPEEPHRPWYFWAGAACGWAVVCDYSGVIAVVVLATYGLMRRASLPASAKARSDAWRFAAGVIVCALVLMGYQWSSFGHPLLPAQHYMPAANFTDRGYVGFDWPRLDLLWATAFDLRYGLFTAAPFLLLALWIPGWLGRDVGNLGRRERVFIVVFAAAFFLFCSANQYGRMQFNTGVRHVIAVVPFLFLLAAVVLRRCPIVFGAVFGVASTYWMWCLCMYRDVERGLGILESPIHITLGGFELPWLTTLERMGGQYPAYFPHGVSAVPILVVAGAVIAALWWRGAERID